MQNRNGEINMELLLFLIVIILAFIAYKLIVFEKAKTASSAPTNESLSSTLNPLFSEKDIASQKSLSHEWQDKVDFYFQQLQKTEKEEIKKHHNSGKIKTEFVPSAHLKNIILNQSVAMTARNATEKAVDRMIEANISILNGKPIKEVSEKFDSERDGIPWCNINLDANAWADKPEIRNAFEEDFLARSNFWQSSWEYILDDAHLEKG
jgi:hypothetical protein